MSRRPANLLMCYRDALIVKGRKQILKIEKLRIQKRHRTGTYMCDTEEEVEDVYENYHLVFSKKKHR